MIEDEFQNCEIVRLRVEDTIYMTNARVALAIKDRIAKLRRKAGLAA
jgi:hypothetical protein